MSSAVSLEPKAIPLKKTKQTTTLSARDEQRLRSASADFEALFVKQMLSAMRKTIPKDAEGNGLIRESQGEKIFRDLLDTEYANMLSRSGSGSGLGEMMFKQLVKRYQLQNTGTATNQASKTVDSAQKELGKLQTNTNTVQAAGIGPKNAFK